MLMQRFIVYGQPRFLPGDYFSYSMNTISEIYGIFKSLKTAEEFCQRWEGARITQITWEK